MHKKKKKKPVKVEFGGVGWDVESRTVKYLKK